MQRSKQIERMNRSTAAGKTAVTHDMRQRRSDPKRDRKRKNRSRVEWQEQLEQEVTRW